MKEIVKYGLILGLICFLAGGLLAVVNAVTEPKIQLQKEKEESLALKEVMPQAVMFKPQLQDGGINYYTAYDDINRLNGFVIKSKRKGYASDIEALTSLDLDLKITNIKILNQNETPGLGNKISEPSFYGQFRGKNLDSLKQVETITGATISSQTVIDSIENKISELKDELLSYIQNAE